MSMNLHSEHFEFWQTPTEVTFKILKPDAEGNPPSASEIIDRYVEWVKESTLDAILLYPDDNRQWAKDKLNHCIDHIDYILTTWDDLLDEWEQSEIEIYMM